MSGETPRKAPGMQTAPSNNNTMHSHHLDQTTARARAAVAWAVLCPQQHSASTFSSSSSSSELGRLSSQDSLRSAPSPERQAVECKAFASQSHQHRKGDVRDEQTASCKDLQRNLLAQYKSDSDGSRRQAKAAEGSRMTFGRGQPLQSLPEGSPSPFQVFVCV